MAGWWGQPEVKEGNQGHSPYWRSSAVPGDRTPGRRGFIWNGNEQDKCRQ